MVGPTDRRHSGMLVSAGCSRSNRQRGSPIGWVLGLPQRRGVRNPWRDPTRGVVPPLREMPAWSEDHHAAKTPDGQFSDNFVRLEILFGDGSEWTNVGWRPFFGKEPPADRVVVQRGGHGDERTFGTDWWIWPLPPPGPMTFVCSWPARGVHAARAVIDGDEIRARAAEAEVLWD